jgi:ATP-binding cassette subfamily F protein 3
MQPLIDCCDLVRKEFPAIDDVLFTYVESILETSGDDFENEEDIFEAIGAVLQEVDQNKTEDSIKNICSRLIFLIQGSNVANGNAKSNNRGSSLQNGIKKLNLDAPVHLGTLVETQSSNQTVESIWLNKQDAALKTVDSKKLEKAEAQLQKKLEKKETTPTPAVRYKSSEATASQVISRKDANDDPNNTANNTKDIKIENFDIAFGEKTLIQGANISMSYGRRYGFVGRNGLGKSTLLQLISSRQLIIPAHITILHVEQEVIGDDTLALQSVLEALTDREALLKEEKDINMKLNSGDVSDTATSRLAAVYAALEAMESDKAPSRASVILSGLGFTTEMQSSPTKSFSGGWRMRLALARALFCKPDLLLLDEPTNMLDMQAVIWLERYLQTWASTLLVVSHDRSFLDEVPTDMLHIHSQRIDQYRGNYTQFVNTMTERLKSQQREYDAQMDYRKHIQDFINKFRFNAKRASLVQSRIKHLESLPVLQPVIIEKEVNLKFPEVEKLSPPILMLSGVSYAYPNSTKGNCFSNCDLSATQESRICIVGENGAGKTTLLKLIMDHISPTDGRRDAHRNLKFGYFSQHHVDQLDMSVSFYFDTKI